MPLSIRARRFLFAGAFFLILAFGLSGVLQGRSQQPPDIFALRYEFIPKIPWLSSDKLSETDFHLLGGEPGLDGTNSANGVAPDGGPPRKNVQEASADATGSDSPPGGQSSPADAINEAEEEALDASDEQKKGAQDEWWEFEVGFEENVQEGEDVSHHLSAEHHAASNENQRMEHTELHSDMTKDGRLFLVDFINHGAYNPNILSHPHKEDTWLMIAQRDKQHDDNTFWNTELVCEAHFKAGRLRCKAPPIILPIAATDSDQCVGDMVYFNKMVGPHDARAFYGPDKAYAMWGSQAEFNCLGQWMQDLRRITDFFASSGPVMNRSERFYYPTDLQRPPPAGMIEKNWFPFWDSNGTMYLHYDLMPRVFAQLHDDGSVGEDLAPLAGPDDAACLAKLTPRLHDNGLEWTHQGTNSLSLTMCNRSDPTCTPTDENTFIFTIIQTKTFYLHGNYEPYAFLFRRTPPFAVHAMSSKPFWYRGRGHAGEHWTASTWKPADQSEMVFTTSIAWKAPGMMYHGYLDDTLFVCFGIEDNHGGAMDVVARDLVKDLAFC